MKHKKFTSFFSAFLALAMVFSLLAPLSASANVDGTKPFKPDNRNESTMQLKAAIAEQLNVLEGGPALHKDLQDLAGNKEVAVIVHLSEKPVALEQGIQELAGKKFTSQQATAAKKQVQAQQTRIKKEMNVKNISHKEGFAYNTVLNGFSTTVKASDLDKLLDIQGVTLIEPDAEVYASEDSLVSVDGQVNPAMDTSISFLGIEKLWAEGIQGQGVKVAVLDTGIDKDHPDFAGIYKGGKNFIPNSPTYTRARADNDASETSPVERPATAPEFNERGSSFYTSHGTHVAGTIAAIGANPYNVKGIAPKVDLYAYRVLGAYGSGATSGIIAAIEESVKEEMDVINLSLGGGANSETDGGSFAINNAMMAGTISVVATGNEGPNRGTMGTPSTARLGIAVGNTTNPEANYDSNVSIVVGDYQLSKTMNLMATTFGQDVATQLAGEFEVVAVPGVGAKTDYNGLDVNGKVALISRGDIAFVEKIEAARAAGAVATLIHNFAGGTNAPDVSGTFLGDAFEFIPSYDVSQTDGDAIRAALKNGQGTVVFSNFNKTMTTGDEVNDSSSRGPSTPNFDIKPDVTAPGTNIMSTIPMYKADFPDATYEEAYTRKTGTSMATPHIAGIAALVKQANPDWNAFDVKVALSNSAKLLNTSKYDVMAQGAGRVEAYAAAHPTILAYAIDEAVLNAAGDIVENVKGTVTFGPQSLKDGNISVTKNILVKDIKGTGGNYDVTVDVTKSFGDANVTVDQSSFTLNGEQLLKVTLTASQNGNVGAGSEILGYIKVNGGGTEVSLPFAADFSKAASTELKDMAITETDLSFNGDGIKDSAVLTFKITGNVMTNYIELWDIMNPDGGEYGDGYIGYLHASNALAAGAYKLDIKGNYTPWAAGARLTAIPDGLYTIDYTAQTASGNPPIIGDYVGPVVVKSKAGTIEGTVTGTKATGKIIDKYVDYQAELVNYGMGYDINTKLNATFEVLENNVVKSSGAVKLAQDGTFSFDVGTWNKNTDTIKVKYSDAAGNKAEKILEKGAEDPVTYTVNKDNLSLQIGGTEQLTVTETTTKPDGTTVENDITAKATFQSANANIATVDKGKVTAIATGETAITVSYKDFTQTIAVKVAEAGQDVITYTVNKDNLSLQIGGTEQLTVTETTTKPDGTTVENDITAKATFQSANANIATVDKGKVTAIAKGETTITVSYKDFTQTIAVKVAEAGQPITTYAVNKTSVTLGVDQQEQLIVTETTTKPDGTVTVKDVTAKGKYSSANNKIATVKNGLVTAKAVGTTQVSIELPGQQPIVVDIEVKAKPQNIVTYTVNKTNMTLGVDQQEQLFVTETTTKPDGTVTTKDVTGKGTYSSADSKIATVKKGLVTAKAAGKTQVRINIPNEEPIYVYLEVTKKAQDIVTYSVNKTNMTLGVDQQEQLYVIETTTKPDGTVTEKDVTAKGTYKVLDNSVATVYKGLVTAKKVGKSQVRIDIPNEETMFVYLEVTKKAQDIVTYHVDKTHMDLQVGQQQQLKVTEVTTKPNGQVTNKDVTNTTKFSVANNQIATVQKGLVTAKAAGKTQVRVMIQDQEQALVYLDVTEVQPDIVTYSANKETYTLTVGQPEQLTVTKTTTKANGQVMTEDVTATGTYNVVNNKVATIKKGLITPLEAGSTQARINIPNQPTILVYIDVKEEEKDVVLYSVNVTDLNLTVGEESQITVTQTTHKPTGQIITQDFTGETSFSVVNNSIATVSRGVVTGLTAGRTQVNVNIPGQDTRFVYLEVVEAPKDVITYSVNTTDVALKVGEQQQLTVIETTTKPDGTSTEKNVTTDTTFKSSNPKVATQNKGLVTAKEPGRANFTVTHSNFTAIVYVTVEAATQEVDSMQLVEEMYTSAYITFI